MPIGPTLPLSSAPVAGWIGQRVNVYLPRAVGAINSRVLIGATITAVSRDAFWHVVTVTYRGETHNVQSEACRLTRKDQVTSEIPARMYPGRA